SNAITRTSTAIRPRRLSRLQGRDTVTGLTQAFSSKNVLGTNGSTLIVTGYTVNDGNSGLNYTVSDHIASGTITAANTSVSADAANSTYSEQSVNVSLTATVSNESTSASIDEGSVTFQV